MNAEHEKIGYLYVNGLNDGKTKLQDRLAIWSWKRKGVELRHAHIDWLDGQGLDAKVAVVEEQVQEMLGKFGRVVLLGSSAGGGLALHVFHKMDQANIRLVTAHARLKAGEYSKNKRASLWHRAHMDTDRPSQAFFDSVTRAETEVIPNLSDDERQRMLTFSSMTDKIVPPELMTIEGVQNHRSLAFGHAGGFLAHLIGNRDLIMRFAETRLPS